MVSRAAPNARDISQYTVLIITSHTILRRNVGNHARLRGGMLLFVRPGPFIEQ